MVTKKKAVKKLQPYEIGELDHYLFGQGNHYEIYKKLGAHEVTAGKKGCLFRSMGSTCKECFSDRRV